MPKGSYTSYTDKESSPYAISPDKLSKDQPAERPMRISEIPQEALTHGGKFHADDVFSGALLSILCPNIQIKRVFQVPPAYEGLAFDIGWGRFDHHQNGAPIRENGVPYAAFGLLWRTFGKEFLLRHCPEADAEREFQLFDEQFIQPLDLDDNTGCGHPLAAAIGSFNPVWDENALPDTCYQEALSFAKALLKRHFETLFAAVRASSVVKEALSNIKDHIVILPLYCPWKQVLTGSEAWFVVYPSQRGGFGAQTVPKKHGENRASCDFPESWAGKNASELQSITGLSTLRFCHNNRFLVTADTQEDAVAACRLAMRAQTQP